MPTNNATTPTLTDLENKLRWHDWSYHYSDDYSAFCRGERSWNELVAMIKSFPRDEVRPLWEKHAPNDRKGKFDAYFPVKE